MKKTHLFLCYILSFSLGAQDVFNQFNWGTTSSIGSGNVCFSSDGSYLLFTNTYSGVSGDKTTSSFGGDDLWVSKFNVQNQNVWQKNFGGSQEDANSIIKKTPSGNFIVGTTSNSPISGNKTVDTKGGNDFWIVKMDAEGEITWQKSFGTTGTEIISDVLIISEDSTLLIGVSNFQGINGDKTQTGFGGLDLWLVLIDGQGNKLWDKTIGGVSSEIHPKAILNALNQKIILACESNSGIGGLKTDANFGEDDVWIITLNFSGTLLNQKTVGGLGSEYLYDLIHDSNGDIDALIGTDSEISGNKTLPSFGSSDVWIVKLNQQLDILKEAVFGGESGDTPISLKLLNNNDLLISVSSSSGVTGNRTESPKGIADCWFIAIDNSTFASKWQKSVGGSLIDSPIQLLETSNSYKIVSFSNSNISIDKTVSTWGDFNFWVFELSKTVGFDEQELNFSVYPNPFSNTLTINAADTPFDHFQIADINGRIIHEGSLFGTTSVDMSSLSNDLYQVVLSNKNEISRAVKVVKM